MAKEEKVYIEIKKEEKKRTPLGFPVGVLLLVCICILFSFAFQSFLANRLEEYHAGMLLEVVSETEESLQLTDLIEVSPEMEDPGELFTEELELLSSQELSFRQSRSSLSLREKEQQVVSLWETEMDRIASTILDTLSGQDRTAFLESQRQFRRQRRQECMTLVNAGGYSSTDNIEYLRRYAELTKERCYELVEGYL